MKFRLVETLENRIDYQKYVDELKTISANDFIKVLGLKQSHEFRMHRPMFILHDGSLLESEQAICDLYTDQNGYAHVDLLVAYILRRAGINRKISEKEFNEIYDLVWNLKSFTNKFNWIQVNSGTKYDENKPYIALNSEITDAQLITLQDILWRLAEYGYKQIEVWADDNNHVEYELNSDAPEYIIHRIKQYFSFGKLYENMGTKLVESSLEYNMNKYDPPYSYQEIVDKYGKDVADNLMKDPVHKWRAETGIELIHREPTTKELNRIWKNWNYMTDDMKRESDNKSIELFNLKNAEHYLQLRKEYSVNESALLESDDESHIEKYHKQKDIIKLSSLEMKVRQRNDQGKSKVYSWYDVGKFVGTILIDTIPAPDGNKWFGSLRINKKYRGHSIGDQIIDFAIKKGASALAVYKDNEVAVHLYEKHGFKISKDRIDDEFYFMYL